MAFLFTVLGEWFVEGKVISRGMLIRLAAQQRIQTGLLFLKKKKKKKKKANRRMRGGGKETGIGMVLSLVGIGLCVQSKT
jgi:hypothetical protein